MTEEAGIFVAVVAAAFAFAALLVFAAQKRGAAIMRRNGGDPMERMEALFRASFPELQPHFHPARVLEFVKVRRGQKAPTGPTTWRKPAGFPAAEAAEITPEGLKDRVRLVDGAGATVAEFVYEEHPEGGVIRYAKGKFTVNVKGPEPRVRYWHPEREFKWTPSQWKLGTRLADQSLESGSGSSSSSSSDHGSYSSSSSSVSRGAAAGAAAGGIIAGGGTFDGGGASAAWDDGGGGGGTPSESSSSESGLADDSSSVASSSSSSSTSY